MPRLILPFVAIALTMIITVACGPPRLGFGASDEPAPTPTFEPVPTFTPTTAAAAAVSASTAAPAIASSATPTHATPLDEPAPATEGTGDAELSTRATAADEPVLLPTPTPDEAAQPDSMTSTGPHLRVIGASVNVRGGPGTEYEAISVAEQGANFPVVGRNEQGDWWQVCCFADLPGWFYGPLVEIQNGDTVSLAADIPSPPVPTPVPVAAAQPEPPAEAAPEPPQEAAPIMNNPGTAGSFDPNAQYQIVHYRVLGFDDNNGGIFNKGGQQLIFVTVLDQNGNGVDGAVVKDAVGDKLNVVVGNKGPGKSEIKMDWDPYKLYVASDPSGPVTRSYLKNGGYGLISPGG